MRLKIMAAAILLAAVLLAQARPVAYAEQQNASAQESKTVEVQPNDTLTKIAAENETTYPRLFDANENITHPDVIYPGTVLRIPKADEQLASRPLPAPPEPVVAQTPSSPAAMTQQSVAQPRAQTAPTTTVNGGVWDSLAMCESGGNWATNTGNGFYGGLQFTLSSWQAVGGSGYPHHASKAEQIARAERLLAIQGWGAWPACSSRLGLR